VKTNLYPLYAELPSLLFLTDNSEFYRALPVFRQGKVKETDKLPWMPQGIKVSNKLHVTN